MKKVNRCLHLCRRQYSSVRAVIPCSGLQVVLIGAHMLLTQVKYKNIACMVLPADVEVNIFPVSVTSCIIGSICIGHFQHILDVLSLLTSTFTWKSSYRPLDWESRITLSTKNDSNEYRRPSTRVSAASARLILTAATGGQHVHLW